MGEGYLEAGQPGLSFSIQLFRGLLILLALSVIFVTVVSVPDTLCSRSMLQNARILGNSRVSRSTILSGICAFYGCRKFSKGEFIVLRTEYRNKKQDSSQKFRHSK
ncbi:hypothetical protein POTOM_057202 [Populus tomentosa]|uniref:Uncharacterized protein n=1 Tax=Populus tomentosa TaxID=118781 RepID=A0A8X7Y5U1_POPTO|nr:hypothetical protein POTOM_057202 [Populus tomentosa]